MLEEVCGRGEDAELALPNELGVVYVGQTHPGTVVLDDHGQPYIPRLVITKGATSSRHVTVSVPLFDHRAYQFLATEACQLPDDDPGVIMIQMTDAPGGMTEWEPTLLEALRLDMYRNVSTICLFKFSLPGTERGEADSVKTVVVRNAGAAHRLPEWADACLSRQGATGALSLPDADDPRPATPPIVLP